MIEFSKHVNILYPIYKTISSGIFISGMLPYLVSSWMKGRLHKDWRQRLGIYSDEQVCNISGSPRIWIHAVSVGEAAVAIPLIESFSSALPGGSIFVSCTTEAGKRFAQNTLPEGVACIFAPLDFLLSVRQAIHRLKPDLLIFLETELWPNWIVEAHRKQVKIALVNGRISIRSIRRYLKIKPFMKEILSCIDVFSMIGDDDADRIIRMGALPDRVIVNGNAKYDPLLKKADARCIPQMMHLYHLTGNEPVFVAGSTRSGEEEIILDVYQRLLHHVPNTLLIIAPRHVERSAGIRKSIVARGISCQFRSELRRAGNDRSAQVVILDTIGELHATYSIATVVFCGGSLVPLGGQNVLEAAVWGKPVVYGPSMDDFMDAKILLDRTGGGIQVQNGSELYETVRYYLNHPKEASEKGMLAKQAVMQNSGSAIRHTQAVLNI